MENPNAPPAAPLEKSSSLENNSRGGSSIVVPPEVRGWSWGAFLLNWIWALFNRAWVGLLCLVPYIGFLFAFYIGFKGREMAWRNKRWDSVEEFNRIQRKWSVWALVIVLGFGGLGILAAIVIPVYQQHLHRAGG
jgi:hypothetical protein